MIGCERFEARGLKQISHRRFLTKLNFTGGKETIMKRLLGSVICAVALLAGSSAWAAPVDFVAVQQAPTGIVASSFFDVFFTVNDNVGINGIQLYAANASNFVLNPAINESAPDSGQGVTSLGGTTGYQTLITAGLPFTNTLVPSGPGGPHFFGTFTAVDAGGFAPSLSTFILYGYACVGEACDVEGPTVLENNSATTEILASVNTIYNPPVPPVPEPMSILLIGAALAALGFVRRTA